MSLTYAQLLSLNCFHTVGWVTAKTSNPSGRGVSKYWGFRKHGQIRGMVRKWVSPPTMGVQSCNPGIFF